MAFLDWLEALPLSEWVATSEIGYPSMLSIHSIGMSAVVGLMLVLDFRVLGLAPQIPVAAFRRFMPYAWIGFALNLISGVLLFNSTAHRLVENWPFLSKMACILAAGGVTFLLWRNLDQGLAAASAQGAGGGTLVISRQAKLLAWASIILWVLAIIFGRLIAYVMDYMILNGHR